MNTTLKAFSTVTLVAILAFMSFMAIVPQAGASTAELGVRAVFVNRNSVLAMSQLRALSVSLKQDGVFSLPQTRNSHIRYTRKLFRCETIDCETDGTAPAKQVADAGDITIRVVSTKTNELSITARGDSRYDATAKPFLSPLTVIVAYE